MATKIRDVVLTVRVQDGQYHIETSGERDDPWPGTTDGVTTGESNWIAIIAGTEWGPVNVRVQLWDAEPDLMTDGWDMAVERAIEAEEGEVLAITDIYRHDPPHVITTESGIFSVRIHVFGRDRARAVGDVTESLEQHLVQVWRTTRPADARVVFGADLVSTYYEPS